jgi:arylformamidase
MKQPTTLIAAILIATLGMTPVLLADDVAPSSRQSRAGKKKAKEPALPPTHADVAYDVHERTKLDFWQAEGDGPRPLKVFIHGGGWVTGDKKQGTKLLDSELKKGISVAAINYRLSTTDPLPAPVHDAVRAIQFLRSKAQEWNIDKSRIVLTGGSAGGCTSLLIACMDDFADPASDDPVKRESSRVQGVVVKGAQSAIDPKLIESWIGPNVWHEMIHQAVGEPTVEAAKQNYAKHEALYREFSAYNHLSSDDPPLYLGYAPDVSVPATSIGHGIHHGMFGIKLKEKSTEVGHNKVYLGIGKQADATYRNGDAFADSVLLAN